jgi:hypothetical protein
MDIDRFDAKLQKCQTLEHNIQTKKDTNLLSSIVSMFFKVFSFLLVLVKLVLVSPYQLEFNY